MNILLSDPVMLLLGLLTHHLMVLEDLSATQKCRIWTWRYIRERPYKTALSVIGAILAYSMLEGQAMPPYVVFGCGYMANDALDKLGSITAKRMQ